MSEIARIGDGVLELSWVTTPTLVVMNTIVKDRRGYHKKYSRL